MYQYELLKPAGGSSFPTDVFTSALEPDQLQNTKTSAVKEVRQLIKKCIILTCKPKSGLTIKL